MKGFSLNEAEKYAEDLFSVFTFFSSYGRISVTTHKEKSFFIGKKQKEME